MMDSNKPKIFKGKGRIVTEILGRNKYTNYKQALNEAVANSLDAKSSLVDIKLSKTFIEVMDDGIGMSKADLEDRYFTLGEKNPDISARAMFGIGVCANAALGNILIIETRQKDNLRGIRAVVDFSKVENQDVGQYTPEIWEEIDFQGKNYSTLVRIEKLRWRDIDSEQVATFLTDKHWPLLLDPDFNTKILVNGSLLRAKEPTDVIKYRFKSTERFEAGNKFIPPQKLDSGEVEGIIYLREKGFEEASIDVYVKNQRVDKYSGDQVDWLRIKDLKSPEGFKSKVKGIIKVEATDEEDYSKRGPFDRNILTLKSDRSGFFEESFAFRHLCAYLNEKSKGRELNLPYGGVLRLINSEWYSKRGADISKTQELIQKLEPCLKEDLSKIFEDEKFKTQKDQGGDLEKKRRLGPKLVKQPPVENALFRCPKCQDILRVKVSLFKEWQLGSSQQKRELQEKYWYCKTCGYLLDPVRDKYLRGPIRGKLIMQIKLADGMITHILADSMGKSGVKALYLPEDSTIMINAEHAMLVYSVKTSDEAFRCYLLDAIVFAIAYQRTREMGILDFQNLYNELSSKISRVIDVEDYENALNQLQVGKK